MCADDWFKHYLIKFACVVSFAGFLYFLGWWYGQPGFEERFDPIKAADEERDAAVKQRDDALRDCEKMGTKYERAVEEILELRDEADKNFQDLPYLTTRNHELEEESIVQYNEIEHLKTIRKRYDDLQYDVSQYGMTAKRPDTYQRESESLQRRLQISDLNLQRSEETVKDLKERLETQQDTANEERDWLRAKLKNNARSSAYWARYRRSNTSDDSRLAWGVRCACTEPETAYALKDQTPRIVELEGIVAARDDTISRLRTSRGNVLKNDTSSKSNPTKTLLPSTPQPVKTTSVHNCKHKQQCKRLEKQAEDDAEAIAQLRKECQELRDAPAADVSAELQEEKTRAREELATKDKEIDDLRADKTSAEEDAATEISDLNQKLSDSRKDLLNEREVATEREAEVGQQKAKIDDLEATQSRLEETIKKKDLEIEGLEEANQEIANQPAPESAETLKSLDTANTDLAELRHQHAKCKEQSETQSAKINKLKATQRELEGSISQKDQQLLYSWTECTRLLNAHQNCDGNLQDLANKLRLGSNAHTDLQVKHNTQMTDLETANSEIKELQSKVATLQKANTTLDQRTSCSEGEVEKYRVQGEDRARPIWQANYDREMSLAALKVKTSEEEVFKLTNELKQAKSQASPLREIQLKAREDAVKAREDAIDQDTADVMDLDHDHEGGSQTPEQAEVKALQAKLGAANKDVGDARLRLNGVQRQLTKEKKERKQEKESHQREMRREKEDFENRSKALKLKLEAENPLRNTVSTLQNEIDVLKNTLRGRN